VAQEVEGARPRHGYMRRRASSMGGWSYRKSKPKFHFQADQEHTSWRLALRVGSRAKEVEVTYAADNSQ